MSKTDKKRTFSPNPLLADIHLYDPRIVEGADYKKKNAIPLIVRLSPDALNGVPLSPKPFDYDDLDTIPFSVNNADTAAVTGNAFQGEYARSAAAQPAGWLDHRIDLIPSPVPIPTVNHAAGFADNITFDDQTLDKPVPRNAADPARAAYPSEDMVLEDEIIQNVHQKDGLQPLQNNFRDYYQPSDMASHHDRLDYHQPSEETSHHDKPEHHQPSGTVLHGGRQERHQPSDAALHDDRPEHHQPSDAALHDDRPEHHQSSEKAMYHDRPDYYQPSDTAPYKNNERVSPSPGSNAGSGDSSLLPPGSEPEQVIVIRKDPSYFPDNTVG